MFSPCSQSTKNFKVVMPNANKFLECKERGANSAIGFFFVSVLPQPTTKQNRKMFLLQSTNTMAMRDVNLTFSVKSRELEDSSVSTSCSVAPAKAGAVAVATPNDIIVGSRGTHHSGPGNDKFNRIIDSFIPKYNRASTKADKGKIFLEIFETVSSFGRFLCHDPKTGLHHEVGEYAAKEKISHALRYRRKRMMKKKGLQKVPTQGTAASLGQLLAADRSLPCDVGEVLHLPVCQSYITSLLAPPPHDEASSGNESDDAIISDEDMDLVLGKPGQYDWSTLNGA